LAEFVQKSSKGEKNSTEGGFVFCARALVGNAALVLQGISPPVMLDSRDGMKAEQLFGPDFEKEARVG
jgi:hypothetical protein